MRTVLFAIIVVLGSVSVCLTQESQSPCMQIENGIRVKAPSWNLVRKSASCSRNLSYLVYQSGIAKVYVFIFPQKSLKDASTQFNYLASDEVLSGPDLAVLGTGWRNAKEENRVWRDWNETGVDLKKGKVVVRVSASTLDLCRQFAEYIGDSLPDA